MINSVVKTFQTIECLLQEQECDLGYISKTLRMPKPTVRRILQTLSYLGYVDQDRKTSKYRPSLKFFSSWGLLAGKAQLLSVARPFMINLSEVTGETVNLGILEGKEVICIDKVASKQALRQDQPIGSRTYAYCTAFGKVQLAFLPENEIKSLLNKKLLPICTKKSINNYKKLERELKEIKKKGYAIDDEEFTEGVCCVGAPIFDYSESIIAGISVAGPAFRMTLNNMSQVIQAVTDVAQKVSSALGWAGIKI